MKTILNGFVLSATSQFYTVLILVSLKMVSKSCYFFEFCTVPKSIKKNDVKIWKHQEKNVAATMQVDLHLQKYPKFVRKNFC